MNKDMEHLEDQHIRAFLDDRTNINFESLEQLKSKREKLLLARTTPVENSDDVPEPVPLPPPRKFNDVQSVAERRRQLQTSKSVSQCRVSNLANCGSMTMWKSFSSLDYDGTGSVRSSKRLRGKTTKKSVKFGEVQVYYFARNLGLSTVPSLEGVSLGMSDKHHLRKTYTFYEYSKAAIKQNEQKWTMIRKTIEDQKKLQSPRRSPRRGKGILINRNFPSSVSKMVVEKIDSVDSVEEIEKAVIDLTNELIEQVAEMLEKEIDEKELGEEDSDDDPNEVLPFVEQEMLQPLDKAIRHAILSSSDVHFDPEFEDDYSKEIRESRTKVGCSCKDGVCAPDTCECAIHDIKCQVDHDKFPCGCSTVSCLNPEGRVEFNPLRVRTHYLTTLKLLKDMEKVKYEPTRFSPRHIRFPDDDDEVAGTSTSYLPTPPPIAYQPAATTPTLCTVINKSFSCDSTNSNCSQETNNNEFLTPETTRKEKPPSTPTQISPSKRRYPVTPTYKRSSFSFTKSVSEDTTIVLPVNPVDQATVQPLRRSPRSPMKRPSLTSIVVVGNVLHETAETCPASKKFRSLEASPSNMATFSQTIDEESMSEDEK